MQQDVHGNNDDDDTVMLAYPHMDGEDCTFIDNDKDLTRKKRARLPTKSLAYHEHIKGVIKTTKNCRIRCIDEDEEWVPGNKCDKERWNRYRSPTERYHTALNTIEIVQMILDHVVKVDPVAGLWFCRAIETLGSPLYLERAYLAQRRIDSGFTDRVSLGNMRQKILQKTHCLRCFEVFSKRTRARKGGLGYCAIGKKGRFLKHFNDRDNICLCTSCFFLTYPSAISTKAAHNKLLMIMCDAEAHKRIHGTDCSRCNTTLSDGIDSKLVLPRLIHFGKSYVRQEDVNYSMVLYCQLNQTTLEQKMKEYRDRNQNAQEKSRQIFKEQVREAMVLMRYTGDANGTAEGARKSWSECMKEARKKVLECNDHMEE